MAVHPHEIVPLLTSPQLLEETHTRFYEAYDARDLDAKRGGRKVSKRDKQAHEAYDVRVS